MGRIYNDWIEAYLDYLKRSEPQRSFHFWTAISILSGALQRKVKAAFGDNYLYPNMYIALVAPPAGRKSTAMRYGTTLLDKVGIKVAPDTVTREGLIHFIMESQQLAIGKETINLAGLDHASVYVMNEELTTFLGFEQKQLMVDLSRLFDNPDKFEYYTKGVETRNYLSNVYFTLIGALTPDLFRKTIGRTDMHGGGLLSRFILVVEQNKRHSAPGFTLSPEERKMQANLVKDLMTVHQMTGEYKFTKEYEALYADWYINEDKNFEIESQYLQEYKSRRQVHVRKLSMILSASRSDKMEVNKFDFYRALDELTLVEGKMPDLFTGIGRREIATFFVPVMEYIQREKETTDRKIRSRFYGDLNHEEVNELLAGLQDHGVITITISGEDKKIKWKGN